MANYDFYAFLIGFAILVATWMPKRLENWPISMPLLALAAGVAVQFLPIGIELPDPVGEHAGATERLAELAVIVSLLGAGLKIERPIGLRRWQPTWLLLGVTMLVTIVAITFTAQWMLGLALPSAVLLGAVLAPTDPVLAADVQSGEPGSKDEDFTRFSLTSEAGLNDGLAFPFTHLAILMAVGTVDVTEWFWRDVVYRITVGVVLGWVTGKVLAWWLFRSREGQGPTDTLGGMVALAITLFVYGAAQLAHGYGFLAVFIAGLVIRARERHHKFHRELHTFTDSLERLLGVVILVAIGLYLGAQWQEIFTWSNIAVVLVVLLVVRPIAGMLAIGWLKVPLAKRLITSFYGIRGIGSIYYLAYALSRADFVDGTTLWQVMALTIVGSIGIHSISAAHAMKHSTKHH